MSLSHQQSHNRIHRLGQQKPQQMSLLGIAERWHLAPLPKLPLARVARMSAASVRPAKPLPGPEQLLLPL